MTIEDAIESGWEGEEAERFVEFYNAVDKLCLARVQIGVDDLCGDWPSADLFYSGAEPEDALEELVNWIDFAPGELIDALLHG